MRLIEVSERLFQRLCEEDFFQKRVDGTNIDYSFIDHYKKRSSGQYSLKGEECLECETDCGDEFGEHYQ